MIETKVKIQQYRSYTIDMKNIHMNTSETVI